MKVRSYQYLCLLLITSTVVIMLSCHEQEEKNTFFRRIPASYSGIDFQNKLTDTEDFNIIQYLYFYNGGGIAVGDINNDGLPDLYFTSNQESNRLYLNLGDFRFKDITTSAGVAGTGNWTTGVTMADVNGDGLLDIFVCGVGSYKKFNGRNQLYINNGDLTFTEQTQIYGLSFSGFSTHAVFFDYDNDGDLDMYLVNHAVHTIRSYGDVSLRYQTDPRAGDKLYKNMLTETGVPRFLDVTMEAGILSSQIGYGLGVGVADLNLDGFPDIYVSNDFHENDYCYINQGNGTFKQVFEKGFSYASRFSMGNDIADVNNDAYPDIVTLDMLPREESIIKASAGEDSYEIFDFKLKFGYYYQYARNTLQIHTGIVNDNIPIFKDVAGYAGIEATDWSWAPLLADFDNDGFKDLFVANGIVKRPNDLDYITYISSDSVQRNVSDKQFIQKMPSGKVSNYFFSNNGDLTFSDVSEKWIGTKPSLSNGAVYADLDNDGRVDLVVNNVNEKAFIYRNELPIGNHFLKIKLNGVGGNRFGIGARVYVWHEGKVMHQEVQSSKGWQSSVEPLAYFGLGEAVSVDSVVVVWPGSTLQVIRHVPADKLLTVDQKNAQGTWKAAWIPGRRKAWALNEVERISHEHKENGAIVFTHEPLLPHMLTTQGPCISVGDVNGDGLEDVFIGGAAGQPGTLFFQNKKGVFSPSHQPALQRDSLFEDTGSVLFDADGNGTLDLGVVSGGHEHITGNPQLRLRLYLNNGEGVLKQAHELLPDIRVDASCIRAADVDKDGDLDLFVGGRVLTGQYGVDPPSYLLINTGQGKFIDATAEYFPVSSSLGMVSDAIWNDINGDGKPDLIVAGEWMPITILVQDESGGFKNMTEDYGLSLSHGWWNTIIAADVDQDGDMDLIAGNLGLNSRIRASAEQPVELFVADIDDNGSVEQILTYYNRGIRYPFVSRDQLVKQVPTLKRKFLKYADYKDVVLEDIIPAGKLKDAVQKKAFMFTSVWLENQGGVFVIHQLPQEAQMFPVFSMLPVDINQDSKMDLLLVGNFYAAQPDFGRYDAGTGLVLLGNGKGQFQPVDSPSSGFYVSGECRKIETVRTASGETVYLVGRNNQSVKVFKHP